MPISITNNQLSSHDFEQLTEWTIRNDKIKPADFEWEECSEWIYAFKTGTKVRYVGIATTVLRSRLDGYSYQQNDRVGTLIKEQLESGTNVEIFGAKRLGRSKPELEAETTKIYLDKRKVSWIEVTGGIPGIT